MEITEKLMKGILRSQKNEITEYHVYKNLAKNSKHKNNANILKQIAEEELNHYNYFKTFTKKDVDPSGFFVFFYTFISRIFGLNFGLRLMEKGEETAQFNYKELGEFDPHIDAVIKQEEEHEQKVLNLIDSKYLEYAGSIVLGLNDALVELTGALAGLTLALQNTDLIAIVGLITGIAASLSMAASEYLSQKEEGQKNPIKSSLLTGMAYIFTVAILILPYFFFEKALVAFAATMGMAILIIFVFNFYIATAKNKSFKKSFLEMAIISLSVAILNFGIGILVRTFLHVDI